jgi:ribosomal protein S20
LTPLLTLRLPQPEAVRSCSAPPPAEPLTLCERPPISGARIRAGGFPASAPCDTNGTEMANTTCVRSVEDAIKSGDKVAAAAALRAAEPVLVRAAQKGVVHKRTASRKVSRLTRRVAKLGQ